MQASHLAAWADFPEEDVSEVEGAGGLLAAIRRGEEELSLLAGFERGRAYREGLETVIAGRPNAGKSTPDEPALWLRAVHRHPVCGHHPGRGGGNRAAGWGAPAAGGHRGLRDTDDPVESIGVQAAKNAWRRPSWCWRCSTLPGAGERGLGADGGAAKRALYRHHQQDGPAHRHRRGRRCAHFEKTVALSAASGEGLEDLEQALSEILDTKDFHPEEGVLFTQRQRGDAQAALDSLRGSRPWPWG